jgi:hypothetical protein
VTESGPEEIRAGGVTEVVGRFADAESFKAAVADLRAAGFEHSDLSVLDTHESLSASEPPSEAWKQSLAGMVGEVKYVGPLTTAGLIAIATGQIGMAIAGILAAGLTGVALRELLEDIKATPHTESFARALEGGAVLLWVAADTPEREAEASGLLTLHGAADVHSHRRAAL